MTLAAPLETQDANTCAIRMIENLTHLKSSNAIIVSLPNCGIKVGYSLAGLLDLPFEVVPCKSILHPADRNKRIGSISADEVIIHDECHDIPRDYIYHQIVLGQNALKAQRTFYCGDQSLPKFGAKVIVIVADVLTHADSMLALLRMMKNQKPSKIIVGAAVATPEAIADLSAYADDFEVLALESLQKAESIKRSNSKSGDGEIRKLLTKNASKKNNLQFA